jgi:F0F1-type ATP synthase assembly protein I
MAITSWIPRIFLLGAVLASIACLGRADYNLPVFLFAYIAWMYMSHQKMNVIMFFGFSLIVDIIWFIVIAWKTWFDSSYERLAPWEHKLHVMTLVLVIINFVLKLISIGLSFAFENNVKQSF